MNDIIKAIEIEKLYIEHRIKDKEPFHLEDKIKECGFETLDEYFSAKQEYGFKHLEFIYEECKPETCLSQVFSAISNKETKFLFMISDKTFVFNCSDTFNKEFCVENNIPIYYTQTNGGTIISTAGDVSLCICVPTSINIDTKFILNHIVKILSKYTNDAIVDGNDILSNGKKVLGSACYTINDMFALVAHVSFNDNTELIENICQKQNSGKTPSYLENITPQLFRQEVISWLQAHSI